jgi:hypothetical protein
MLEHRAHMIGHVMPRIDRTLVRVPQMLRDEFPDDL